MKKNQIRIMHKKQFKIFSEDFKVLNEKLTLIILNKMRSMKVVKKGFNI